MLPTPHLDARSCDVQPFPALIRLAMAALVLVLKALTILATGSQLAKQTSGSGPVEDAILFDPQQLTRRPVGHASQEGRAGVPAVADNDGMQATCHQQGHHSPQLAGGHFRGQVRRTDPRCPG